MGDRNCVFMLAFNRGRSGRKKSGQGALPDGGTALGCRKVGVCFPLAQKKPEIHFSTSTPEAGLSGQKSIKRPCAKNIIDTAFSFEGRGRATLFFEHMNFQPRACTGKPVKPKLFIFFERRMAVTYSSPARYIIFIYIYIYCIYIYCIYIYISDLR